MSVFTLPSRLMNVSNRHQGAYNRVLCVCSGGILRSPTTAWVLGRRPWYFNTRAAGLDQDYALIPVDAALVLWADEIVCAEQRHADILREMYDVADTPVHVLGIPDTYAYRDPKLVKMIRERCRREVTFDA